MEEIVRNGTGYLPKRMAGADMPVERRGGWLTSLPSRFHSAGMTEPTAPADSAKSVDPSPTSSPAVVSPVSEPGVDQPKAVVLSNGVLAMGFIILVLLGALLALNLRPKQEPRENPMEIAARIKKDSEALISMSGQTRDRLSGKEAELLQRTKELREAEMTNRALASQVGTLRGELDQALARDGDVDGLRARLDDSSRQVETLTRELADTRAQLAQFSNAPTTGDVLDLQRRLEESERAKGFFEKRVQELEAKGAPSSVPDEAN